MLRTTGVFRKATLSYPLYELINKTVGSLKVLGREGGGVSQDIGAVGLAATGVALLLSVLEYNVAWFDITPFLPICLVQ